MCFVYSDLTLFSSKEFTTHLNLLSVDRVSFVASVFEANESDAELLVVLELERPQNINRHVNVTVRTMAVPGPESAKGKCTWLKTYVCCV